MLNAMQGATVAEVRDRTALSYWFPKLEAAGIPVPKTRFVAMPPEAQEDVWKAFDGEQGPGAMPAFCADLRAAANDLGTPFFLRTDHTSGKHDWERTCFVSDSEKIASHVFSIAEYSEIAGMFGELPWSNWVVREYLPIKPFGVCPNYGNMPVCREFRFFVDDGELRCAHPYWPRYALERGGWSGSDEDFQLLCRWPHELKDLAETTGRAVSGSWSIDILETHRGWFVTDMAEAHKSFHWEGCDVALTASQQDVK